MVHDLTVKLEALIVAISHSSTPRVRAQVAAFLAALQAKHSLTPALVAVRETLLKDPRASVRRLAKESP